LQFGLYICCSQDCFPVNSSRQRGFSLAEIRSAI